MSDINKTIAFKATEINCYVEIDVTVIGIADDPFTPENYIIFTRYDEDDNESIEDNANSNIGLMTHLSDIEYSDSIEKIEISRDKITFLLKPSTQNALEMISIDLQIGDSQFTQLQEYLSLIIQNSHILLIEK